ncbi:sulfate adenylyltransferase subunit CysD [Pelosinus sp. UFO1]|uniref:sulfate adenylyltransferase subunit CysD n=1 Tax=Pelosinus sp. UFO1 TaxID=484770 RepID=UPI0004D0E40B|nr:sulfate adenylyltransferase subunit CysD [Pelosinus sp. UFO1]AIF50691.1 Sulfate adenylyltransferase [Pelosinus sp. UFO1]
MDHLDRLEAQSIFILREAYKKFGKLGMLWSIGKDSTVMLWLAKKAFFGHCPFPFIHVDTTHKIPEMITFRDRMAKEYNIELIVHTNEEALQAGMGPDKGRLVCCKALKTDGLQQVVTKYEFEGLILGIRRDEEGSRSKERVFSERNKDSEWDYTNQAPELWDQFKTDFPKGNHIRVHPILHWNEMDIWAYIEREKIELVDLYFAKNGKRYRSLGCAPCTGQIDSNAVTVAEIIEELKNTKVGERAGRAQDQEDSYAMQKLRKDGYM